MDKNSSFNIKNMLNCNGQLINLDKTLVMGILNVTPDSFYDGEKSMEMEIFIKKAHQMIEAGTDIIDIGGMSTRPEAEIVSPEEEIARILPVLKHIKTNHPTVLISIDTIHASVAEKAIQNGADIINDVSGGTYDHAILDVVAKHKVPYILMYSDGIPARKIEDEKRDKAAVLKNILQFFIQQIQVCKQKGIKDIIIDPGFGFGKTLEENYSILKNLEAFRILERPILVGISRKSMIYKKLNCTPQEALNGTTALHSFALSKKVNILRVHDVKETVECRELMEMLN